MAEIIQLHDADSEEYDILCCERCRGEVWKNHLRKRGDKGFFRMTRLECGYYHEHELRVEE